eukprot:GHVO01049782.1.p1 GENE.GHVO01049782.1~~GHVO01049782.1.p1  ORF type:complete len:181 (-),score=30.04 GHVO01049782.1:69-611(-)
MCHKCLYGKTKCSCPEISNKQQMEGGVDQKQIDAIAKLRERMGDSSSRGKGAPRRNKPAVHVKVAAADEKKVSGALKRMGVSNIPGIEEVSMLFETGDNLQFTNPKVQAAPNANTYILTGPSEKKFDPSQLLAGADNVPHELLKKIADSLQSRLAEKGDDEDEVPEVTNFEEVASSDDAQ